MCLLLLFLGAKINKKAESAKLSAYFNSSYSFAAQSSVFT